jgi:hypothetical protein
LSLLSDSEPEKIKVCILVDLDQPQSSQQPLYNGVVVVQRSVDESHVNMEYDSGNCVTKARTESLSKEEDVFLEANIIAPHLNPAADSLPNGGHDPLLKDASYPSYSQSVIDTTRTDNIDMTNSGTDHDLDSSTDSAPFVDKVSPSHVSPNILSRACPDPMPGSSDLEYLPKAKPKSGTHHLPWYQGCEYQCVICGPMFYSAGKLRRHARQVHSVSADDYTDLFVSFESRTVYHRCLLCGSNVKQNRIDIFTHLANDHEGIGLADYGKQFCLGMYAAKTVQHSAAIDIPGTICSKVQAKEESQDKADNVPGNALKRKLAETSLSPTRDRDEPLSKISLHKCLICSSTVIQTTVDMTTHLRKHQLTLHCYYSQYVNGEIWSRQSRRDHKPAVDVTLEEASASWSRRTFGTECQECGEIFTPEVIFWHVIKSHDLTKEEYVSKWGNPYRKISKMMRHTCNICNASVAHTKEMLEGHFESVHGLTTPDYYDRFRESISWLHPSSRELRKKTEEWAGQKSCQMDLHQCHICYITIDHDYHSLKNHLSQSHKTDLHIYYSNLIHAEIVDNASQSVSVVGHIISEEKVQNFQDINHTSCVAFTEEEEEAASWSGHKYGKFGLPCKVCGEVLKSMILSWHVYKKHGIGKEEYLAKYNSRTSRKPLEHKCMMCGVGIIHKPKQLEKHFRLKHSISTLDYYHRFKNNKSSLRVYSKKLSDNHMGWATITMFECKICNSFTSSSSVEFLNHIKTEHDLRPEEYSSKLGLSSALSVLHQCRICFAKINHDYQTLNLHTTGVHKVQLNKYYLNLILFDSDEEECKINAIVRLSKSATTWSKNKLGRECKECGDALRPLAVFWHAYKKHGICKKEYLKKHGNPKRQKIALMNHKCLICETEIIHNPHTLQHHFVSQHGMSTEEYYSRSLLSDEQNENPTVWANRQTFECKTCLTFSSVSADTFLTHVKEVHNMRSDEYSTTHGLGTALSVLHQCRICFAKIEHEFQVLKGHAWNKHKVSLKRYYFELIHEDAIINSVPEVLDPKEDVPDNRSDQNISEEHICPRSGKKSQEITADGPKTKIQTEVQPQILSIACMERNSLRIIDGRGGIQPLENEFMSVIKEEIEKSLEVESSEIQRDEIGGIKDEVANVNEEDHETRNISSPEHINEDDIDIKNEFVSDD